MFSSYYVSEHARVWQTESELSGVATRSIGGALEGPPCSGAKRGCAGRYLEPRALPQDRGIACFDSQSNA